MSQRSKTFSLIVAFLFIAAVVAGLVYNYSRGSGAFSFSSQASPSEPERQPLPSPSPLTLPPLAPLPPQVIKPHHFPPRKRVMTQTIRRLPPRVAPLRPVRHAAPRAHVPSKYEIIRQFYQVISLDDKYYQIAVESDRYGYRGQAIVYYKKYLFVAPTGPHASEVRSRLSQLQ